MTSKLQKRIKELESFMDDCIIEGRIDDLLEYNKEMQLLKAELEDLES